MNYPHPILAKEGCWPFIAASFVLAVLASSAAGFWRCPLGCFPVLRPVLPRSGA